MTGEITLHGNVLPIGGLREKSMAAYREGMKVVLIPKENQSDLYEVDPLVKKNVEFIPVSNLQQVLKTALIPVKVETEEARKEGEEARRGQLPAAPEANTPVLRQ